MFVSLPAWPPPPRRPGAAAERPSKPALSRDGIVATAVALMRAEGLEHVTMRRLAAELDTGAASLYVYVRARPSSTPPACWDELLGSVEVAAAGEAWWWVDVVVWANLCPDRPASWSSTPAWPGRPWSRGPRDRIYLSLVERLLGLLRAGGVPDPQVAWGIDLLLLFATSIALEHGTRRRATDPDGDEEAALAQALLQADSGRYPHISDLGEELLSGTPKLASAGTSGCSLPDWPARRCRPGPPRAPGSEGHGRTPPWRDSTGRGLSDDGADDPSRLTPRLRAILAIVLVADVLDLMDSTITTIAAPSIVARPRGRRVADQVARGQLRPGHRRPPRGGRPPRRPLRQAADLPDRHQRVHGRLGRLRAVGRPGHDHRWASRPGRLRALMIPQGISILMASFTRAQLPRELSAFGPAMGIAAVLGPIAAGFIISANIAGLDWRPVFLINIVLGLAGLVAALKLLPDDRPISDAPSTQSGAALLGAAMLTFIFGLIEGSTDGMDGPADRQPGLGCRVPGRLRPPSAPGPQPADHPVAVGNRGFTSGLMLGLAFFAAVSGLAYVISLFFQIVLGLTARRRRTGPDPGDGRHHRRLDRLPAPAHVARPPARGRRVGGHPGSAPWACGPP